MAMQVLRPNVVSNWELGMGNCDAGEYGCLRLQGDNKVIETQHLVVQFSGAV